ncbi:hypothetical protein [Kitasatospora sp. NPDC059673]|uniref:hypothetical protein n=1 Tax=Kitasatospora sp. NPDC059673 TaxID=3346901 RepID=UPI0036C59E96
MRQWGRLGKAALVVAVLGALFLLIAAILGMLARRRRRPTPTAYPEWVTTAP